MQARPPLGERIRPLWRDALAAVAGLVYASTVWMLFLHKVAPALLAVTGVLLILAAVTVSLRWLLYAFVGSLVALWLGGLSASLAFAALPPLMWAVYRIAGRLPLRISLPVLAVALTGPLAPLVLGTGAPGGVFPFTAAIVLAWITGYATGEQRRYQRDLLTAERDRAARGVTEERMRIARELHDIIAHGMGVITVQASYGALVAEQDPPAAKAVLAAIEATGRQSLEEMRRLLEVLHDGAPVTPAPGLADLPPLLEQVTAAGVQAELVVAGSPRQLPAGVELTLYRIVQEALTNVIKHANSKLATVTVSYGADFTAAEITDYGRGGPTAATGFGLAGMRERVRLYGGQFSAGPATTGFRVYARLPLS